MASKIFQQYDDTPSGVSRSVQDGLTRRFTLDTKYGLITPNFVQYLYPGESLRIRPTTFVKLPVPLNRPQLSRVRFVQRFYKIDLRTLWLGWEEYIKGTETAIEDGSSLEVPYVVNTTNASNRFCGSSINISGSYDLRYHGQASGSYSDDFSNSTEQPRVYLMGSDGYPGAVLGSNEYGAVFGVHDLGDYLDCALGQVYSSRTLEGQGSLYRHAFDFAAYQLIYSYGFRNPRVQKRVDDYYQMYMQSGNDVEYPTFVRKFKQSGMSLDIRAHWNTLHGFDIESAVVSDPGTTSYIPITGSNRKTGIVYPDSYTPVDLAQSTDSEAVNRTSWESCEHFPLKGGANTSLLAFSLDSNGFPVFKPSTISLSRMRYANWTSDRFITATLSPQEGDESAIPVQGTINVTLPDSTQVSFSGLSVQIPAGELSNARSFLAADGTVYHPQTTDIYSNFNSVGGDAYEHAITFVDPTTGNALKEEQGGNIKLVTKTRTGTVSGSASASFSNQSATVVHQLAVSPSDFRFYMQLQKIKEMQQQTDNRYKSYMTKFFASRVPDSQLDRPQFIGGYVQDLDVTQVNQTSDGENPLGTQAGQIADAKTGYSIRVHADQHCLVMGVCFIMPDTEYVGGQNREFVSRDRFDWMLPQLGNISKQAIYNYELAYTLRPSSDTLNPKNRDVFGYEPVYNYLRWSDNRCVGTFRDSYNSTGCYEEFKPWIVKRDYGADLKVASISMSGSAVGISFDFSNNVPTLSDEFLSMRYGVDDSNFSISNELMYPFMVDSYFDVRAVRKIPTLGIPRV